ncbi:MAG: pyridoxal-phosphate dependent enzyme [Gemmatimonadales bacterium]
MSDNGPTLGDLSAAAGRLAPLIRLTPTWDWNDDLVAQLLPRGTELTLKLELFQHAGSFKTRGALLNIMALGRPERQRGVTAVSAGNHAAAVSYAASVLSTSAKVVMPEAADPFRVALCRSYGAEVVLAPDVHRAFAIAQEIEAHEGRTFVHPFEGVRVSTGTGTLGLELLRQRDDLDAVVVPVGGGGLISGIAAAVKQARPGCLVLGVEPMGNDVIRRSIASGQPERAVDPKTIADSLSPPFAMPYSLGLIRRYVDDVVLVSDEAIEQAMYLLFSRAKLAVEPAAAAATAAVLGPLRERLAGKRVGVVVCGTNIGPTRFSTHLARGEGLWLTRG